MDYRTCLKVLSCFVLLCVGIPPVHAQFYYQDIYNTLQTNQEQQRYKADHISGLDLTSLEPNQDLNKDFQCHQTFSKDYRSTLMETSSFQTGTSTLSTRFNDKMEVTASIDSSASGKNTTTYSYDSSGRLIEVAFTFSSESGGTPFAESERHVYTYDSSGILRHMKRIKDGVLFSTVSFTPDSLGRPLDEVEMPVSGLSRRIAYHYTTGGQLSDIYTYNPLQKKWLPMYLFDYDAANRLTEMTTVLLNENSYLLWKYTYNQQGLKDQTSCFGKNNQPQGIIKYSYSFQ